MIYNGGGGGEWEKNGETLDYVEGNGGVWKMVEWDRHHYPMCMYVFIPFVYHTCT